MKNEWLTAFKIALIELDCKRLGVLQESMPSFRTEEEVREAQALIAQAIELFRAENEKTQGAMDQLKKAKMFHRNKLSGQSKFDKSY